MIDKLITYVVDTTGLVILCTLFYIVWGLT